MIATERTTTDGWVLSTEDDGCHGVAWFASLGGVLWAKGWMRTRSEVEAETQALLAGRTAFALDELRAAHVAATTRQAIPMLREVTP